jgi:methyl-accepting chemotaxis protein
MNYNKINENWQKHLNEEKEQLDELTGIETAGLAALAALLLKPSKTTRVEPGGVNVEYSPTKLSLLGSSLGELLAMSGMGALAGSGVGQKLKSLYQKLKGEKREVVEKLEDQVDEKEIVDLDEDKQEQFISAVKQNAELEKKIAELMSKLKEDNPEVKEQMSTLVDDINDALRNLSQSSSEAEADITNVSKSVDELASLKDQIKQTVKEFASQLESDVYEAKDVYKFFLGDLKHAMKNNGELPREMAKTPAASVARRMAERVIELSGLENTEEPVGLEID